MSKLTLAPGKEHPHVLSGQRMYCLPESQRYAVGGPRPTWVPPEEAALIRNGERTRKHRRSPVPGRKNRESTAGNGEQSHHTLSLSPSAAFTLCGEYVQRTYPHHSHCQRFCTGGEMVIPDESPCSHVRAGHRLRSVAQWCIITLAHHHPLLTQSLTGPGRRLLDRLPPWSLYQTFHGVNYLFSISSMLGGQINIPLSQALLRIEKVRRIIMVKGENSGNKKKCIIRSESGHRHAQF